jgi:hypothetical protein
MKRPLYIILALLTLSLAACHKNAERKELRQVDSLLQKEQNDSAFRLLSRINATELTEEDRAYRNLLLTIAQFKCYIPIPNDSIITTCIHYYKQEDEREKLAISYLYHGAVLISLNNMKGAVNSLKEAETLAKELRNTDLSVRTNIYIAYINGHTGNPRKSLEYIFKALEVAKKSKSKRWIGYCYDHIGSIYSTLNMTDSSNYYIEKSIPYTTYLPKIEQPYLINNQAVVSWRKGNLLQAEDELKMSLSVQPMEQTYALLTKLYTEQNRLDAADSLWKHVLQTKDLQIKVNTLYPYSKWLYRQGKLKEAWEAAMKLPALKDSLAQQQQAEAIMETQVAYDKKVERIHYRQRIERLSYGTAFLLLLVLIGWMVFYMKSQRTKKQLAENQLLLTNYGLQLERLIAEGKEQSKEVKELKRKIEALRLQQTTMLAKGKQRYEEIVQGGKATTWKKADFIDFMEYYRIVNLPFVVHLEDDYRSLPVTNKFMLSLYEIGFDDETVMKTMNMTEGALRTAKSRIKSKYSPAC